MNIVRCRCGRLVLVTADGQQVIVPHKIDGKRCVESGSPVEPELITTITEVHLNCSRRTKIEKEIKYDD